MELQKVLSERRSIRRYKNSSIPQNDIETIIQAAQEAINGADNTGGATCFSRASRGHAGVVIGNHVFY